MIPSIPAPPVPDPADNRRCITSAAALAPSAATGGGSGRLDPHEISGPQPCEDSPAQVMRFAHSLEERRTWLRLIDRVEPSQQARDRFRLCGTSARLAWSASEKRYFVSSSSCRNRFCPACRVRRQMAVGESLNRYFVGSPAKEWQFITLTMKHTKAPLALQLDWLQRNFKLLRKDPVWKDAVTHGFACIEVTRNNIRQEWHPHFHILAHVRFLDWSKLRSAWCRITKGSNVIDCKRVACHDHAIKYILAYVGKAPDTTVLRDNLLMVELYTAMKSTHLLIRFGRPPVKPPPAVKRTLPSDLVWLGGVDDLIDRSLNGDEYARLHLENWLRQRKADARSLNSPRLIAAVTGRAPPDSDEPAALQFAIDVDRFNLDLATNLPF